MWSALSSSATGRQGRGGRAWSTAIAAVAAMATMAGRDSEEVGKGSECGSTTSRERGEGKGAGDDAGEGRGAGEEEGDSGHGCWWRGLVTTAVGPAIAAVRKEGKSRALASLSCAGAVATHVGKKKSCGE